MAPDLGLTLKLTQLPPGTTESDVRRYLREFPGMKDKYIKKVSEPCQYSGLRPDLLGSVVTLQNLGIAQKLHDQVKSDQRTFRAEHGHSFSKPAIDLGFLDLTTLYCSRGHNGGGPTIDIIGVHGLSGHGYNSWVYYGGTEKERQEVMWLKDVLPDILESRGIYPRIMVYGYRSNMFVNTNAAKIDEPAVNLYNCLNAARHNITRPLYFFAHSLGGIVAKQTITLIDNEGKSNLHPVRGCVFFGTPHRGTSSAETARAFLTVVTLFTFGNQGNANIIVDLLEKSAKLADINQKFLQVRAKNSIGVLSCFEQVDSYNGKKIVNEDSACLEFSAALPPFPIDADHSKMIKFADASHQGFEPVIHAFLEIVTRPPPRPAVVPAPVSSIASSSNRRPKVNHPLENKLRFLSKYDTVFLVDDSDSMGSWEDENYPDDTLWRQTEDIFSKLVPLAIKHDRDGIDIRFLNATNYNEEKVKLVSRVQYLFAQVEPDGDTPIGFELEGILKDYLREYDANRKKLPLNLIVLTDGAPDDWRVMEDAIVEAARRMQELGARNRQIGIQFVQIGNDPRATEFLKRLDDELGINNNTLDIVDTVKHDPHGGDQMILKILLGAIKDDIDGQAEPESSSQPSSVSPPPRHYSSWFGSGNGHDRHGLPEIGSNSRQGTGFGQRL